MKDGKLLIIAVVLMLAMMFVMTFQNKMLNDYKHQLELVDTTKIHDTIYQTYVFTDTIAKYKQITKLKTDTIYLITGDTLKINLITKEFENTLTNKNQDTIQYKAYVTGRSLENEDYPTLDSINIKTNNKIIYTETIIEKPIKYKQSRWNVTAGVGTGYGIINKQADIYLGFTIGYRVW